MHTLCIIPATNVIFIIHVEGELSAAKPHILKMHKINDNDVTKMGKHTMRTITSQHIVDVMVYGRYEPII